ncbi:MAG: cytochrome c peroxidase, partial [Thermodesulfobacteriota bacterium]
FIDQAISKEEPIDSQQRKMIAKKIFESSTRNVAQTIVIHLDLCLKSFSDYTEATEELREARQIWASFEHEVKNTDPKAFVSLGQSWLELSASLGNPGVMGVGSVKPNKKVFKKESKEIISYVNTNFGNEFMDSDNSLQPLPRYSKTFQPNAKIPPKLPPGNNINKQVPRPRQILNMVARGVDESETALIALGDMAFDSAFIFGEPARSLSITCNTCHNKSITNPQFFIPGLSKRPGGMDVSNSFFAPHANNGVFDSLDIPDLRGIRFTAPYGRNGRIAGLREFIRNVIMHEFNGPEPDPLVLDGLIAYMNEFDFLPNPRLNADGSLSDKASKSAKRGEKIFKTPFKGMGDMSCATCHIPSNNFLDRRSHDIGTVAGSDPYSRDRAMDTPTLLGIKYTSPYFHDGSQPSVQEVLKWFNEHFNLDLKKGEMQDLTAYVDTVAEGVDAYEDTSIYLDAEMEEFSFFLSAYEYLKEKNRPELMNITFQTISQEIKNHKWELQDQSYLPIMNQLAQIMDEAVEANLQNNTKEVDSKVAEYRKLYKENVDNLK